MVDFGGWDMPVQYPAGIAAEHTDKDVVPIVVPIHPNRVIAGNRVGQRGVKA